MNNNRGNNRRRGRGGNRQQGGGQQLNRIDSRARGNAPQLLEKYRKLAHDAHLNGDRVQEEYYLQFADHYFRVLADQRQRQEEQREQRQQRGEQGHWREDGEDGEEGAGEGDFSAEDQQQNSRRRPRDDRFRDRDDRDQDDGQRDTTGEEAHDGGGDGDEDRSSQFEPAENPFVRDNRNTRGLRPRQPGRSSAGSGTQDDRDGQPRQRSGRKDGREFDERGENEAIGLDPELLPPAIASAREEVADGEEGEAKPRRRVARKPRRPADDAGEKLETVT
ncbi:MAG: DUF4167 domain-containing protein [Novosphingobium sp.]